MSVLAYRERVTVMDVLEAGACIEGVLEWVRDRGVIAARTADYPGEKWISEAVSADCERGTGYGDGDYGGGGYGYGNGYGDGYGDGDYGGNGYGDLGLVEAAS